MKDKINPSERCIIVGVILGGMDEEVVDDHLEELEDLIKTAGGKPVLRVKQRREKPDSATFIGRGKAEEIVALAEELEVQTLIFDDDLTPAQVKNLEKVIPVKILDRSQVILDIFALRARTREAKTQVELAQLNTLLPRLTRQWTHLSRQVGGIGVRGVGETQLETDRRIIRRKIKHLKDRLIQIERSRSVQRGRRHLLPRVALVGYTNAGKSTLFNRLTGGGQFVENRLFATLDSKVSRLVLEGNFPLLLADTVGFIRKLPHHLVASFRSTLEESLFADLLILLIDISHPRWQQHRDTALEVLANLGIEEGKVLTVANKIDRHDPPMDFPAISAKTGEGIEDILARIRERLNPLFVEAIYTYPPGKEGELQNAMRRGTVLEVFQEEGNTCVRVRIRREEA